MSDEIEYQVEETRNGSFVVSGPVLANAARFDNREKALAFCRYAIGGRSGGGFIRVVNVDGNSSRELFQGSRHLYQTSSGSRG